MSENERQVKYQKQRQYMQEHTKFYGLRMVDSVDADLIAQIEKNLPYGAYLRKLIRDDIRREMKRNKNKTVDNQ